MKNFLLIILFSISFGSYSFCQSAEDMARQLILEKLVFYYIENPNLPKPSNISPLEVDKATIAAGNDLTTSLWTNPNNVGLKNLLIKLLHTPSSGGDFVLQTTVKNVLLITGKKVKVYLFGDFQGLSPHSSWPIYCTGDGNYPEGKGNCSWPCASTISTTGFTGHISLGAYYFSPSGYANGRSERRVNSTFIHELTHTQIPLTLESDMIAAGVDMYGNDGNHTLDELIPSDNSAFNEGIANGFAMKYYFRDSSSLDFIPMLGNPSSTVYVETLSQCGKGRSPGPHCIQDRLASAGVVPFSDSLRYKTYLLKDIPAPNITHDELFSSNIFYHYMKILDSEMLLVKNIKDAAADRASRRTTYTYVPILKKMMETNAILSLPGSDSEKGKFLAIGLMDFFTGFKISNKSVLERMYGITWDSSYPNVDEYFSNYRNALLQMSQNGTVWRKGDLIRYAQHLNLPTPHLRP
jgi:hypothetical protein